MGFELGMFESERLDTDFVDWLVEEHWPEIQRHFVKLWEYYSNPTYEVGQASASDRKVTDAGRCYVQAQEYGLPSRITGLVRTAGAGVFAGRAINDVQRKEVVIENDIAWRVNAAVDFLFGKPVGLVSRSPDSQKRTEIESIIKAVFTANGDIGFFQDMAVLGSVYGFVDCIVRPGDEITDRTSYTTPITSFEGAVRLAQTIGLELIEAPRALPVLDEDDYRRIRCYIQHFQQRRNSLNSKNSFLGRLLGPVQSGDRRQVVSVTEVMSGEGWQRYEDKELVAEGEMPWGFLPVVHIQNVAQPYYYEGLSDVEPLLALQD